MTKNTIIAWSLTRVLSRRGAGNGDAATLITVQALGGRVPNWLRHLLVAKGCSGLSRRGEALAGGRCYG